MKNFLFIILLSSISCISYAQDLEWRYFSPFPFAEEYDLKQGINGENYIINSADELYKITDCSFGKIDFISPDPNYNFIYGFGSELSMINDSTWFVNFFNSYYTSDGGNTYQVSEDFINLSNVKFISENLAFGIQKQGSLNWLVKSEDKGMSWEKLYESNNLFLFDIVDENQIFIVDAQEIFHTNNSGSEWSLTNDSFYGNIDFVSDSLILSKRNSRMSLSIDKGTTFEEVGHFDKHLTGILPSIDNILYINEHTWVVLSLELLYITEDSGENWEEFFPLGKELIYLNQAIKLNDNEILLNTAKHGLHVFDLSLKQITNCYTSSENLNTIHSINLLHDSTFYIVESTWVRNLLFKSTDSLQTITLHTELPETYSPEIFKTHLKFKDEIAYYIADSILYSSEEPYMEWELVNVISGNLELGLDLLWDFEILKNGTFITISRDSIYRSIDNGNNWNAIKHIDLVDNQFAFEIYPTDNYSYWIGYSSVHIDKLSFIKYDNFEPVDTILLNLDPADLAHVSYVDNKLYISTDLVNRVYHEEEKTLETLCSFGNRSIIKVISEDSIYVTANSQNTTKDIALFDIDCNLISKNNIQYNYRNSRLHFRDPFIHIYADDNGILITDNGQILKLTDNLRPNIDPVFVKEYDIDELNKDAYLYPNPAHDIVSVKLENQNLRTYFYSFDGEFMGEYQGNSFDISHFPNGLYAYGIYNDKGLVNIGKLVKM